MASNTIYYPLLKKGFQEITDNSAEFQEVENNVSNLQNAIETLNTLLSNFERDENGNYVFEISTKFLQDVTILGTQHVVSTEEVQSDNDYIVLRNNNPLGLSPGTYAGFKIKNYDGNDTSCLLVVDANGWARVGDENGIVQKIATIEENPTTGQFVKYNATNKQLESAEINYNDISNIPGAATTSTAGLMSAADKTKLDGIANNANNYSLPTASASTLGGVKVGTNLSISNGVLSATDTTYGAVSKTAAGLCPQLPNETTTTKYLRQDGTWVKPPNTTYSAATTSAAGLMSAADKTKLDGIADNANKYVLSSAEIYSALGYTPQSVNNLMGQKTWTNNNNTATAYRWGRVVFLTFAIYPGLNAITLTNGYKPIAILDCIMCCASTTTSASATNLAIASLDTNGVLQIKYDALTSKFYGQCCYIAHNYMF